MKPSKRRASSKPSITVNAIPLREEEDIASSFLEPSDENFDIDLMDAEDEVRRMNVGPDSDSSFD